MLGMGLPFLSMTTDTTTWYRPITRRSQEVSRRNARVALATLLARRQEREDADHYVELLSHSTRQSSQS